MDTSLEATLIIIISIFVLFTSMLEPKLAAGIAGAAVLAYVVYKIAFPKRRVVSRVALVKKTVASRKPVKKIVKKSRKSGRK